MREYNPDTCTFNLWQAVNELGNRVHQLEHSHNTPNTSHDRHINRLVGIYDRSIHSSGDRDALAYAILELQDIYAIQRLTKGTTQ